ncbi:MAG TPA: hypothetical protein VER03_00955 [Bryobacteraceae bacterium]|nr:hypothetical protein [Bryobacteraceae bacterium]
MAQSGARLLASAGEHDHSVPTHDEVRAELRRILESPLFSGSKRCQQFLQYVCEKSLKGEAGALKERAVATEVFGRNPQSDLAEDTIVRVGAREVRKRLAQYYMTAQAATSKVRISLPSGSYAPDFRYVEEKAEKAAEETIVPSAPTTSPPVPPTSRDEGQSPPRRGFLAVMVAVLLVVAVAAIWATKRSQSGVAENALMQFWRPVFASSDPLLLVVGHPVVYHPSTRAINLSEQRLPPMTVPVQRPIRVDPKELDGSDIIPVLNQYVGFGDMVVGTEVAAMLARHNKSVRTRLASSVPFADLRQAQTLLIGAFTNRWTMELSQNWRFRFRWTHERRTYIADSTAGNNWSIRSSDDGSVTEDYILVSRIINSSAGGVQILAAGIKQFGTEAAGRLLTDSGQLEHVLNKLPAGWADKNVQLVLHVKVIGNTPAQPELLAWHVW